MNSTSFGVIAVYSKHILDDLFCYIDKEINCVVHFAIDENQIGTTTSLALSSFKKIYICGCNYIPTTWTVDSGVCLLTFCSFAICFGSIYEMITYLFLSSFPCICMSQN